MSDLISALEWRYATKQFDSSKTVRPDQVQRLQDAVRLSASSFGLQPYCVYVVSDDRIKTALRNAAYDQPQLSDASHVFVFCCPNTVTAKDVDAFIDLTANTRRVDAAALEGYAGMMKGFITQMPSEKELQSWAAKQAYIALGTLLTACAHEEIDSCPLEGFNPDEVDRVLGLQEKGLHSVVICSVGFRNETSPAKVRRTPNELFVAV